MAVTPVNSKSLSTSSPHLATCSVTRPVQTAVGPLVVSNLGFRVWGLGVEKDILQVPLDFLPAAGHSRGTETAVTDPG